MNMIGGGVNVASGMIADISMEESSVLSLDELMVQAYSTKAAGAATEQQAVLNKLQQPEVTSDPAELFKLQQRTADYNLQVSLISTLTRKGVGAVETLLRS